MPDSWDFSKRPRTREDLSQTPLITYLICLLAFIVTTAYASPGLIPSPIWAGLGILFDPPIEPGLPENAISLILHTFLHGGFLHLFFNLYMMYQLGRILEGTMHPLAYIALFACASLVSMGAQYVVNGGNPVGLSGVLYAFVGMMWAGRGAFGSWRDVATGGLMRYMVFWGVFCIATTELGLFNVANVAHFAGLLFGVAIGYVFYAPRRRYLWIIPMALVVALAVLVFLPVSWVPLFPWLRL